MMGGQIEEFLYFGCMKAMICALSLFLGLIFSCKVNQEPVLIPPSDPAIQYLGRIDTTLERTYRFAWTASQLSARFTGTSLRLELGAEQTGADEREPMSWFRIQVDDLPPKIIQVEESQETVLIAKQLPPGEHRFHLFKRSEAESGTARFYGIYLDVGAELLPPPSSPPPWIEAYGNSITCGYGNECADRDEAFSPATEDGYHTYAAIAARQVGANYTAVAWSGRGVFQNYDRSQERTIPAMAETILPGSPETIGVRENSPEIILINLGTNDFAHGTPDKQGVMNAYRNFLQNLRHHNASSQIVLLTGSMMRGEPLDILKSWLDELQAEFSQRGDGQIHRFDLSPQGELGYGCQWHPTEAQHEKNGQELAAFISQLLTD
ncbi:MAG: SGNH/GDSL hydrolase family protein [Bacteroidota bacterium]